MPTIPISQTRMRNLQIALASLAFLIAIPQFALAQPLTLQGMITARDGAQMTVTSTSGTEVVVTLTDATKVVATQGALGIRQSELAAVDLINGLPVTVEAVRNGAEVDATKITFKQGDLKTARQVEAGTAQVRAHAKAKVSELEAKDAEMRKRMSEANQYVEKGTTNVYFAVGSSAINADGKRELAALADKAKGIKGYMIGVVGHADPTGDADANQRLSEKRAEAVIRHLQKFCGVQPYRVMASDAMGEAHATGDVSTAHGLAQNRRVQVQILVNKGLEGL